MPVAPYQRREFISNSLKIVVLSTIIPSACKNRPATTVKDKKEPVVAKKGRGPKRKRNKWSYEGLVVNKKTNLMHLPSSRIYHYYDPIKQDHIQTVAMSAGAALISGEVRLPKSQSGNIVEILSLQPLRDGINDGSLTQAADILSIAFSPKCENKKAVNANVTNFRLHELMLQLVTLNNSITDKWQAFNDKVKKPPTLRKRQLWMENPSAFQARVQYILNRQQEFQLRLITRAQRNYYS